MPGLYTRVLLVEDDEAQAALLSLEMRHVSGAPEIVHVQSIHEAGIRLQDESFGVILLDLSLPDSFGIETLRSMQDLAGKQIPIVVLSGYEDERVREEALRMGAAEFVVKGRISPEGLAEILEQAALQHQ